MCRTYQTKRYVTLPNIGSDKANEMGKVGIKVMNLSFTPSSFAWFRGEKCDGEQFCYDPYREEKNPQGVSGVVMTGLWSLFTPTDRVRDINTTIVHYYYNASTQ